MKMRVTIEGPQGVGKTVLAEWLAAALELSSNEQVSKITVDGESSKNLPNRELILGQICTEVEIITR